MKKKFFLFLCLFLFILSFIGNTIQAKESILDVPENLFEMKKESENLVIIEPKVLAYNFTGKDIKNNKFYQLVYLQSFPEKEDLKEFIYWLDNKEKTDNITENARLSLNNKEIREKGLKIKCLDLLKKSGNLNKSFFYMIAQNPKTKKIKVIEIQGAKDYLIVSYISRYKEEIKVPFQNEESVKTFIRLIGKKRQKESPFFLTVDTANNTVGMAMNIFEGSLQEKKVKDFMKNIETKGDICKATLVYPVNTFFYFHKEIIPELYSNCKNAYLEVKKDNNYERLRLYKSMLGLVIASFYKKKSVLSPDEIQFVLDRFNEIYPLARSDIEKFNILFKINLLKIYQEKIPRL